MAQHIHTCSVCKVYTLEETCPQCNAKTVLPKPPKFSPEDKYGDYRRKVKREELCKKGLC
ncbi:RNA-protein complex protein Nop10 [Candidatus Woesearchaeota archaeon]|jgi:H/ACA ribonucleoprotein complex subunit 3|nr:RNA-protein complex protein Nop10 [Candidatus Woesearchaeota archaeon]MBT5396693.1 RNA-protein complex protein Nop10 [Candidatus Woesearchaeota archaeon]MBT5924309.1 RNA-protein complex protein Nop10 [Candidatus Woesearchaeota archaeon]MBT6367520.1 RNA-protein complex protein Nop10 [Candidatus Woesearchaeota archaeon]MBT7763019.1 RNA-protein complex protein Nop10 [Candidatus Woesearchaeota archaeon]